MKLIIKRTDIPQRLHITVQEDKLTDHIIAYVTDIENDERIKLVASSNGLELWATFNNNAIANVIPFCYKRNIPFTVF